MPSLYGLDDEHVTQSVAPGPLHTLQSVWQSLQEEPTPNVPTGHVERHSAWWRIGSAPSTPQLVQLVLDPKHVAQVLLQVWQAPRPAAAFTSR